MPTASSAASAERRDSTHLPPSGHVLLSLIEPDPHNARKTDPRAASETALQESVAELGVVVPVLVRPFGDAFRLVHGHRRYRAALALGHEHIPAHIRQMTDAEAAAAQVAENLSRERMSDLDQWRAVVTLQDKHKWPMPTAARALGLGEHLIRRMDKIGRCAPDVMRAMEINGPPDYRILATIASAPLEVQKAAVKQAKANKGEWRWHLVEAGCRVERIPRARAKFDTDPKACRVRFEEDLFGQGGSDSWTTTDVAGFLAAQKHWLAEDITRRKASGERIGMTGWNRDSGGPVAPPGAHLTYDDAGRVLPKKGKQSRLLTVAESGYRLGEVVGIIIEPLPDKPAKGKAKGGAADEDVPTPAKRDPVTKAGQDLIARAKTTALHQTLRSRQIPAAPAAQAAALADTVALLILALCARNVKVNGDPENSYHVTDFEDLAAQLVGEGGALRDTATVDLVRLGSEALARMLICSGPGVFGSGEAAEWVGKATAADLQLPRFDSMEFLATVSGELLRDLGKRLPHAPEKQGALRSALAGNAADWRPPMAAFHANPPETIPE